jgi:OmpA-OmpF porin, OOP family
MQRTFTRSSLISKIGLLFGLVIALHTSSQNLVADSSFEHNKSIPLVLSGVGLNNSWFQPSRATTDLFCECDKKQKETSEAQVPNNPMGTQKANTGKCYAGIYALSHGEYREYLMTQFTSPLEPGVKYELYFYISLSDHSRLTVDQIGACFLHNKLNLSHSNVITGFKPVYAKLTEEVGTDTINWHQILIEYKARGGEQYLLLGSFDVNEVERTGVKVPKGTRTRINQRVESDAYYYIDDVTLREYTPPYVAKFDTVVIPKIDTLKPVAILSPGTNSGTNFPTELDQPMILKNVLFETGKAVLLPSSFPELDATADHLTLNPHLKIKVNGYTDNVGNETQNQILSEKRAKAVVDYLINKSIDPGRITHKGFGSQNPIADNSSDEGRKQNRRVELVFSK